MGDIHMNPAAGGLEGSYPGDPARLPPGAKLECKICWWVYDPAPDPSRRAWLLARTCEDPAR